MRLLIFVCISLFLSHFVAFLQRPCGFSEWFDLYPVTGFAFICTTNGNKKQLKLTTVL